ncbi:MAG: AraC family transcriptional regulator [Lachnospiraceae bacterium]|nr:AraC family transcriptional regulator [Lachnospiraceae bacterium]
MIPEDKVKRNKHYRCLEYSADQDSDLYLIACGKEQCDVNVINGPDVRKGYHLHVVLSGTGTLIAGGQEFHPHFGQMFLLKDGEEVTYFADEHDPWEYCWVTFNGREAEKLITDMGFVDGVYVVDSSIEPSEFFQIVYRMHEKPEMNYYNDFRRTGLMMEFIALGLEATATKEKTKERRNEHSTETYINLALEFIHFNYATITVNDIIEYIGFTRSYFTTVFKEHVGVSLQKYLLQHRLMKACEQLVNTDMSVGQIAASVGYDNALTFSRSFKNAYGISPTVYREKHS